MKVECTVLSDFDDFIVVKSTNLLDKVRVNIVNHKDGTETSIVVSASELIKAVANANNN